LSAEWQRSTASAAAASREKWAGHVQLRNKVEPQNGLNGAEYSSSDMFPALIVIFIKVIAHWCLQFTRISLFFQSSTVILLRLSFTTLSLPTWF
jgi:hypothetical protein